MLGQMVEFRGRVEQLKAACGSAQRYDARNKRQLEALDKTTPAKK
jgi:hypothetical protein